MSLVNDDKKDCYHHDTHCLSSSFTTMWRSMKSLLQFSHIKYPLFIKYSLVDNVRNDPEFRFFFMEKYFITNYSISLMSYSILNYIVINDRQMTICAKQLLSELGLAREQNSFLACRWVGMAQSHKICGKKGDIYLFSFIFYLFRVRKLGQYSHHTALPFTFFFFFFTFGMDLATKPRLFQLLVFLPQPLVAKYQVYTHPALIF